jgi:aspartate carbamoyltransferase catalytic subunit
MVATIFSVRYQFEGLIIVQDHFFMRHFLGIDSLDLDTINTILDDAWQYVRSNRSKSDKKYNFLNGLTLINLFYENSTRTRVSFEIAGKRLGLDVVNVTEAGSSAQKGESLKDTLLTLSAMKPDIFVIRHPQNFAPHDHHQYAGCPVINGGDGTNEHPTQAMADALVLVDRFKTLDNINVAICGDIKHSRVARSNALLLSKLGARVRLVAPPAMQPAAEDFPGIPILSNMEEGIEDANAIMMLRIQKERFTDMPEFSMEDYHDNYGLTAEKMALAIPDVMVMHPGPMNRGTEIASDVADGENSVIRKQVEYGVAVRMAILDYLAKR